MERIILLSTALNRSLQDQKLLENAGLKLWEVALDFPTQRLLMS
jgi:hypothetical protein